MTKSKQLLLGVAALGAFATLHANGNLLINGSFELLDPSVGDPSGSGGYAYVPGGSAQIVGWVTQLSGVEIFTALDIGVGYDYPTTIADGIRAVDLPPYTYAGGGGISQTFNTNPGVTYDVSFYGGAVTSFGKSGFGQVLVTVGDAVKLFEFYNDSDDWVWERADFQFVASGTTATLSFVSLQDPASYTASIDNVSVTAVPEPATAAVVAGIGLFAFSCYRRLRC